MSAPGRAVKRADLRDEVDDDDDDEAGADEDEAAAEEAMLRVL